MKKLIIPTLILVFMALACANQNRSGQTTSSAGTPTPTPTKQEAKLAQERARVTVINEMERNFLEKGMDVHFTWQKNDTLKVTYVLMSRPMVYQIQNDTDFIQNMGTLGVKKVILTDGFRETWTISP